MSRAGLSRARLDRMRSVLAGHVERGALPGLVTAISRRGEAHVDAIGTMAMDGGEPMRRDAIFRIASLTKPVTAVAALILAEECKLRLDVPVDRFLPELANRRVLERLDGPLDDTVPAKRAITLRDLLTFRAGYGAVMAPPGTYPIQEAISGAGLAPSANPPQVAPDEYMRRIGQLPLLHQPGERWLYHTGSEILGVLIARASGQSLESFFRERIFAPLGMQDTGFSVPTAKLDRLPPAYQSGAKSGELALFDGVKDSRWGRPPVFEAGGGGLVSTADDFLAFGQMLLNGGSLGRERILSRPSVELMTTDHIAPEQKVGAEIFLGPNRGWGFGVATVIKRDEIWTTPGQFGWAGGTGTAWASDPRERMVCVLMTQRLMDSPGPPAVYLDFWNSAYQAIED